VIKEETVTTTARRLEYLAHCDGAVVFADNRDTLLLVFPEHQARIRRHIPDSAAHLPAFIVCRPESDEHECGVTWVDTLLTTQAPDWWTTIYFQRTTQGAIS